MSESGLVCIMKIIVTLYSTSCSVRDFKVDTQNTETQVCHHRFDIRSILFLIKESVSNVTDITK